MSILHCLIYQIHREQPEMIADAVCLFSRDLIKVFKWYVDRIVDAEHQDHIQQVLKVRPLFPKHADA